MASKKKQGRKRAVDTTPAVVRSDDGESGVQDHFLIVAIGASAGGLEAFSQLLRALPDNPGLAVVFVQHMAPHHESALATLLGPASHLPVVQIVDDTPIEINHVYVIPPNHNLVLRGGGHLRLQPRPLDRSQHNPIDHFFQSVAQELGSSSVGVILSGTGSDGVDGVHAIKAVGGIALVQDPASAKQDGMPRAAISTGKIDLILKPAEIAAELTRMSDGRPVRSVQPRRPGDALVIEPEELHPIFQLLRSHSGVDFSQYKLPTLQRRIQRRMALHKLSAVDYYVRFLQENPNEIKQLYQDILIHVTHFFREPDSFQSLAEEVFPAIVASRQGDAPIRVWVPACSTGEEPYSVAIMLMECLDRLSDAVPIQIFATDISETAIEQARAGVYPPSAVEDISPERLRRFFNKTDGHYRINKPIRDLCVFARQDLTRDPPFSKLDLIVCRNVLIYLGQPVQSRLIGVFHYALKPSGYLMLGNAETIGSHADLFAAADKRHRIYKKKVAETPAEVHFAVPFDRPMPTRPPRGLDSPRGSSNIQNEANRLILDRYAPPGVVVNEDLRIVQFRGQTGRFLEPAPGDASLNLLKMCREGLLHGLRTALQLSKKKDGPVRREGLRVKTNGDFVNVTVEVVPLAPAGEGRHYLVLFRDAVAAEPAPQLKVSRATAKRQSARETTEEIERLQTELVASREYLQSIIQDLEAANEELQSANEEILSSNEELQSTNEELDTAKEELQSTNEELNTVNEELHGRNEELARTNSDLVNFLNGVQIAVVIVSGDMRIRRFTPMAERVLNLIPGDIGRPIGQINPNINCPDLEKMILDVVDTMSVHQREVQDSQGRLYSMTIRPYKNVDNRIDGAVLALIDCHDARQHEIQAEQEREYAEAVFNTVREPLAVLNAELRLQKVNPAFCRLFQLAGSDVIGRDLHEVSNGHWDIASLRQLLSDVLPNDNQFEKFEVECEIPKVGRKRIRMNGRRISSSDHRPAMILLGMEEIEEVTQRGA